MTDKKSPNNNQDLELEKLLAPFKAVQPEARD
jgi:hypothetical protein